MDHLPGFEVSFGDKSSPAWEEVPVEERKTLTLHRALGAAVIAAALRPGGDQVSVLATVVRSPTAEEVPNRLGHATYGVPNPLGHAAYDVLSALDHATYDVPSRAKYVAFCEVANRVAKATEDVLGPLDHATYDVPSRVDLAAEDVPDWGEQPATEATARSRATGATIPAIIATTEVGRAKLGAIKPAIKPTEVGRAKLGATKPAIKPTEAHCLVLIALCEVLIPICAILTCLTEVLTAHGELTLSIGSKPRRFAGNLPEDPQTVGPLEIVSRICEVLVRLAGLLPCRAEVLPRLVELRGGSVIANSVHADSPLFRGCPRLLVATLPDPSLLFIRAAKQVP
jgi:hypothetical protein